MENQPLVIPPAIALVVITAFGCAPVDQTFTRIISFADIFDEGKPGQTLRLSPEQVADQENCQDKHARLDASEVYPTRVEPGKTIKHRLIYTACPGRIIRGKMITRIFFGYKVVLTDVINDFTIKPGQWVVNSDIIIPQSADIGSYVLEVKFRSAKVIWNDSSTFSIVNFHQGSFENWFSW